MVEAGAPAEDTHHEFGGEGVICEREAMIGGGVQEVGSVGRFALNAEEDIEGSGAGGGYGHVL